MSYISIDIEADWPCPWLYSIVSIWAVIVESELTKTFYAELAPISDQYNEEALAISWFSRWEHECFNDPQQMMEKFEKWIEANSNGKPKFIADNLAFDWQWINYYFHKYLGYNPFWFSWTRINDLYAWMEKDVRQSNKWQKKYRKTKHSHNPVDDAKWNAEAVLAFKWLWLNINLH